MQNPIIRQLRSVIHASGRLPAFPEPEVGRTPDNAKIHNKKLYDICNCRGLIQLAADESNSSSFFPAATCPPA